MESARTFVDTALESCGSLGDRNFRRTSSSKDAWQHTPTPFDFLPSVPEFAQLPCFGAVSRDSKVDNNEDEDAEKCPVEQMLTWSCEDS